MIRWTLSLAGLALAIFAVVALSGPGRIDIEDGQARFEAGRNWILTGEPILQDPRVVWHRFPGRGNQDFSYYRLSGEVVAALFAKLGLMLAPHNEGTQHFIYALNGAATAALLAVVYALWFRRHGAAPWPALLYALGGIVCTPCWYYSASTFDDAFGTLAAVLVVVLADRARSGSVFTLVATGLAVGLALNTKQPLAAMLLPALAFADKAALTARRRVLRAGVIVLGLALGGVVYIAYENWKFPPEQKSKHAAIWAEWGITIFDGNPVEALADFAVGPSAGAIWYCPTLLLGLAGLRREPRGRMLATALGLATIVVFYACLTFYKGGVGWGPRYLTPVFGVLWLFAPEGVCVLGAFRARLLLVLGFAVQVLGLAMVPERLYVERNVHSAFYIVNPWWYFQPSISHLLNRPREIADALTAPASPEFTPSPSPTFTLPVFDPPFYNGPKGIEGVRRYTLLNEFRPWWATYPHLPVEQRPVAVLPTVALLLTLAALGGAGMCLAKGSR